MKNYWRCYYGDGGFDQKTVVAPRLRSDGGIRQQRSRSIAACRSFDLWNLTKMSHCILRKWDPNLTKHADWIQMMKFPDPRSVRLARFGSRRNKRYFWLLINVLLILWLNACVSMTLCQFTFTKQCYQT